MLCSPASTRASQASHMSGIERGGRGEHLRRHLRVVAGLKPVDRNTRCQQAGDHRVAGVSAVDLRARHCATGALAELSRT